MDIAPTMPGLVALRDTGEVTAFTGRYARDIAMAATHMMGGAEGLVTWARSTNGRLDDFWTKIFPKTIVKQVEVEDRRSIVDLLSDVDAEDAARVKAGLSPPAIEASFTEFAPVKVGVDDEEDDD